jgi:hypothetical protein
VKLCFADLPAVVQRFLSAFPKAFVILDESSKIRCNHPAVEAKKSSRTRLIKLLGTYAAEKCILTATLESKSPVNMYDQFNFLKEDYFPESMYAFAERYCIMETLRFSQGRRVLITEDDYAKIRRRLIRAWQQGGKEQLSAAMESVFTDHAVSYDKQQHIMEHREYSPFINHHELLERIAPVTLRIKRKDIFDITHDQFVKQPIMRPVELAAEAKRVANELVKLGFTDNFTLGKAPALELLTRIQDVCNGFEPIHAEPIHAEAARAEAGQTGEAVHAESIHAEPGHAEAGRTGEAGQAEETGGGDGQGKVITYRPFPENPKLDALMELLEEIDGENNQVVVWSSRKLLIRACADRFTAEGVSYVVYDGSAGKEEKKEAERKFVSGEARVFLANQASGAYGLNCLARCAYAVYICINDSVEQYYQSQHRILRGELKAPKFAYHIYTKGTVEERQQASLARGRELIEEENKPEMFLCV